MPTVAGTGEISLNVALASNRRLAIGVFINCACNHKTQNKFISTQLIRLLSSPLFRHCHTERWVPSTTHGNQKALTLSQIPPRFFEVFLAIITSMSPNIEVFAREGLRQITIKGDLERSRYEHGEGALPAWRSIASQLARWPNQTGT